METLGDAIERKREENRKAGAADKDNAPFRINGKGHELKGFEARKTYNMTYKDGEFHIDNP